MGLGFGFGFEIPGRLGALSLPVTDGLALWLDASDLSTITESGGSVSQWSDKSESMDHLVQASGSLQPVTGAETLNGRNVLTFAGAEQLDFTTGRTFSGGATFFIVHEPDSTSAGGLVGSKVYAASQKLMILASTYFTRLINGGTSTSSVLVANTSPAILTYRRNTEDLADLFVNGGDLNRLFSDVAQSGDIVWSRVGNTSLTQYYSGKIAEIIMFDRELSNDEINSVGQYLSNKWGIAWDTVEFEPSYYEGLTFWLDAMDADTITEASLAVSQVDDKSFNGRKVSEANASLQPTYDATGLNGLPTINFNGDNLSNTSFPQLQNFTIFTVVEFIEDNGSDETVVYVALELWLRRNASTDGVVRMYIHNGTNFQNVGTASAIPQNQPVLINTRYDSATLKIQDGDNTEKTTSVSATINSFTTTFQLRQPFGELNLSEVIVFNRALSDDEIAQVKAYLQTKWSL